MRIKEMALFIGIIMIVLLELVLPSPKAAYKQGYTQGYQDRIDYEHGIKQ